RQRRPTLSFASIGTFILLLAFVLVGLFVLVGYLISRPVTLTYWYTEGTSETPVIRELIGEFQQMNHNIKINAVSVPFGQAQSEFITASAAGNAAPDILRSD